MGDESASMVWTRVLSIAAASLATVAGVAGVGVIADARDRLHLLEQQHHERSIQLATLSESLQRHVVEAEYWKRIIDENRAIVGRLASDTKARPDPYTGTDAKRDKEELLDRIQTIERKLK